MFKPFKLSLNPRSPGLRWLCTPKLPHRLGPQRAQEVMIYFCSRFRVYGLGSTFSRTIHGYGFHSGRCLTSIGTSMCTPKGPLTLAHVRPYSSGLRIRCRV